MALRTKLRSTRWRHGHFALVTGSHLRRRMRLLGLMLLAVSGCATLGADALTKPMRVPVIGRPAQPHRDVSWTTADGLTLRGWVFDPEGTPRGLVVLVHGKDINRQHFAGEAVRFTRRGWQVLTFDQRAHGASDGQRTTFGFHEVDDLKRGLDLLGATRVVLIGESLGAAVSLQTAARDPRVVGCVAGASFSDLETIAAEHRPFFFSDDVFAKARTLAETEAGFRLEAISPQRDVATIATPVLLLHGTKDTFIHPDHARRLHASGPSTELVWLEGVGHIDVLVHSEAWGRIEQWMEARSL